MSTRDPAKRIPKSIGTETKLLGTYTLTDLAVGLVPGVLVILVTQTILPSSVTIAGYSLHTFTLPLAGVAIAVGAIFVYLTPSYTTSVDWFGTFVRFHTSPSEQAHEEAKTYTQIERIHPRRDAIERTDGAFIGVVQVTPPSMALATDEEWESKVTAFQEFLNTAVEFPIQIFSTTQDFPTDEYVAGYEARLSDSDVKANPRLAALIEHYVDWYETELQQRQMTIRDHYVVVPVTPAEVQFERESLAQKLADLPYLGLFVRAWFAPRIEEQREAMFDALDERLRRVEKGLRDIDGCTARRIGAADAVRLIGDFWAGEPLEYGDMNRVMRTTPLVRSPRVESDASATSAETAGIEDTDSADHPGDDNERTADAAATVEYEATDGALDEISDIHKTLVTPSWLESHPTAIHTGEWWTRTLWVAEYPDTPVDGFFETLYSTGDTRDTDITIHLDPRDTHATLDRLENKIEDLEADYEYLAEKRRAGARGVKKDLEDYQAMYDVLRNTSMTAYDASMFLTVRGKSRTDMEVDAVSNTARRSPANLTPVTPRWSQTEALVSCSPVAVDRFNETMDARTPMMAGAVGAMFPFVAGAFAEPGIEYGTYALNESPLIIDRFNRETGYCMMVIGKLGAGKSFSTKLQLVRRAMYDGDTIVIMLDPLEGFAGVNAALGGERVTVGGTRGFNPLELKATPEHVLAAVPDLDPWAEQIAWVLTFFDTFFTHVANNPLGDRKQTLRRAVQEAYERRGITRDPATHRRESPTVGDVIAVLEDVLDDPAAFGYPTAGEQEGVRRDAQSLLKDLRPSFREDGDLANLAQPTEFDLDSTVIYLDLHQEEGTRGRTETSLMMQVLFNAVYERAKQTQKKVVFVIDEAHYLMNDATSLEFLETAVRHSRHYDLSLQFITQTGGEFALTPETRTIANLCSMTLIHRVNEEAEKLAEWFGLNEREVNWVRTAKAGNDEDGYSEALLGIDEEGWFPLRIRASEFEAGVIDGRIEPSESVEKHGASSPPTGIETWMESRPADPPEVRAEDD